MTAAFAGFAGCASESRSQSAGSALGGVDARVETVVSGLEIPWTGAFRDDTLYLTERPGRIVRVPAVAGGEGSAESDPELVADLTTETEHTGEGGLLGLAFHPDDRDIAYVYQTYRSENGPRNRVLRGDFGRSEPRFRPIATGIPASSIHNGGRLAIEGDALYATAGDASQGDLAQDRSSLGGKVLRFTLAGESHPENPFDDPVFSYGHRNPQGLAFRDGRLYSTEHGPSHDDEINLLEPGGNYGWPGVMGTGSANADSDAGGFIPPLATYTPTVAPASAAFYDGPIDAWRGDLFFGALAGTFLGRVRVSGRAVSEQERLLEGEFGRLRTVFSGPDGHLYVTTSNRDGRGSPTDSDDRVLRIRPR